MTMSPKLRARLRLQEAAKMYETRAALANHENLLVTWQASPAARKALAKAVYQFSLAIQMIQEDCALELGETYESAR